MKKVALIVDQFGGFQVCILENGSRITLASDENLEQCLRRAASIEGPLVIPISTETTDL